MNVDRILAIVLIFIGLVFFVLTLIYPSEFRIGAIVASFIMAFLFWRKSKNL
ncbi:MULTISPECIES: hypothetical protein [Bacilli]|uniref:hypothetical protein n=1 Tax=Bacilli TaxID=91061 RepID=UPI00044CD481|nr:MULTISPECIES: hypothetical protein [Bacilli]EGO2657204.1 hypothetical protein [Enterococcus faecalis]EGO6049469.1 hypothetical protein [Enterococcus faecalis]EGO6135480.1 hypothetical protein [Enterococcus faecalis]EGO6635443.1 hypothetical protein [Enterococcus faecalis]EGO8019967.1 hypothetical protein [Enterococcus faecalis]